MLSKLSHMLAHAKVFARPIEIDMRHLDDETRKFLNEEPSSAAVYCQHETTHNGTRYDVVVVPENITDENTTKCLRDIINAIAEADNVDAVKYRLAFAYGADVAEELPIHNDVKPLLVWETPRIVIDIAHLDNDSLSYLHKASIDIYHIGLTVEEIIRHNRPSGYVVRPHSNLKHDDNMRIIPETLQNILRHTLGMYDNDTMSMPPILFYRYKDGRIDGFPLFDDDK